MLTKRALLSGLLLMSLAFAASSQGYMGTVTTGTGIIPPVTVGSGSTSGASLGAASSLVNLTGSWSVDLRDLQNKHLELQIFQDRELIVGSGELTAEGSSQRVAAAGFVAGDRPTLFVSLTEGQQAYRLQLSSSGTAIAGEYEALTAGGNRWSGTATGSVAFAAGPGQATILGKGVNPGASLGAFVGNAVKSLDEASGTEHTTMSRSFFQTSNGQTTSTSEGTTVTSS